MTSVIENTYTSTGAKFWCHPEQMMAYKEGLTDSIISTHVSPEGACNLNCSYCSVRNRKTERIELDVIKEYIGTLLVHGLRAVILTGGGEPTLYPYFAELVEWLWDMHMSVGLITNGSTVPDMSDDAYASFKWVRVSLNTGVPVCFPLEKLAPGCTVGFSKICCPDTAGEDIIAETKAADLLGAKYIRLLPDCTLPTKTYDILRRRLLWVMESCPQSVFIQQKNQRAPRAHVCHQAYFRPYLSEVNGGTVFPCDSVVLNNNDHCFIDKYAICKAEDVGRFLNRRISMTFKPCDDCGGCVFADTVDMLEEWTNPIEHEDFV